MQMFLPTEEIEDFLTDDHQGENLLGNFLQFINNIDDYVLGCPKKTLFLNFASAVEPMVRIGVQRPQKLSAL